MDSLMLYLSICQNGQPKTGNKKLEYVDQIVGAIYSEIVVFPFDMKKSGLMVEIMKMYEMVSRAGSQQNIRTQITSLDAYMILRRLKDKINNENIVGAISSETLEYANNLFGKMWFKNPQQKELKDIGTYLKEIQQFLDKKRLAVQDMVSETKNKMGAEIANTCQKYPVQAPVQIPASVQAPLPTQVQAPTQIPAPVQVPTQIPTPAQVPTQAQIPASAQTQGPSHSVESNKESISSAERIAIRRSNNRINIQEWHNEVEKTQGELLAMQPMVSELLKKVMSFSNDITENYVFQFAKMQLELFNLIADHYEYHNKAASGVESQDYKNAVSNYIDFMEMIIDNLSAFGVEEITSAAGTPFDGKVHEVLDNTNFAPRSAVVKESIRTGFQYKDIVLQKEKIRV